ncbi:catalase-like [Physella acuta]|uniref:catalase-like n=1 Tax=Physella acuta TaxID=109671 RepID=UPI0027DB9E0F|nr:catalase-like [Physella acuta]
MSFFRFISRLRGSERWVCAAAGVSIGSKLDERPMPTLLERKLRDKVEETSSKDKKNKVKDRGIKVPQVCPTYKPCERECTGGPKLPEDTCINDVKDKASEQLNEYKKAHQAVTYVTAGTGTAVGNKSSVLTAGLKGPIMLQDFVFLDEIAHFNREKIAERAVGAKGAGAFGVFDVTDEISKYCKASIFGKSGKKTQVAVRFSNTVTENGATDSIREPKGISIKFYAEDGVWDFVGYNIPVYSIKDPMMFPSLMHSLRRNPVTHLYDADMFWDFVASRPETIHQILFLFSSRGIPYGYRYAHYYGVNTYKMVNKNGEVFYCKFHLKSNQGINNFTNAMAEVCSGTVPNYAIQDLYNAIAEKVFPTWTMYIQVMTLEEAEAISSEFDPLDATKVWPHRSFPLIQVGRLTLNRNPKNYFTDVEQIAFSPAHMIPGIEPSPDKILQGRLFAYSDAQRHRLGANYLQIPVNTSPVAKVKNYQRDGQMCVDTNQEGAPNYFPNCFNGPIEKPGLTDGVTMLNDPEVQRTPPEPENFDQPRTFYTEVLDNEEKAILTRNIAEHLTDAHYCIQQRVLELLNQVDSDLGKKVEEQLVKVAKNSPKFE